MADNDVTVYTRGGRLVFTAGMLRNHIGETATLSFWIRLGEGAVEGHSVSFYHYQRSGVGIDYNETFTDITAEWSYREVTGTIVDRGTFNTGAYYDGVTKWLNHTSTEFYGITDGYTGVAYSFGEMWLYDWTGSQKYEVYGVNLQLAESSGGGWPSMSNGRNLYIGSKTFTPRSGNNSSTIADGPTSYPDTWRVSSSWAESVDEDGFTALTRSSGAWGGFAPYIRYPEGTVLTLSFDLKKDAAANVVSVHRNVAKGNVTTGLIIVGASDNVSSWGKVSCAFAAAGQAIEDWERFSVTLETTEDVTLQWRIESSTSAGLSLRKMKLEYGTEATPWRPAPEDLEGASDMILATDTKTLAVAVDVKQVDTYYLLQASTASAPAKPTTASPSGWTTTEPTYDGTATSTLYTCVKTTLTDGTFYWSAVSRSTSYEAAKTAWNKADAANALAETADGKADDAASNVDALRKDTFGDPDVEGDSGLAGRVSDAESAVTSHEAALFGDPDVEGDSGLSALPGIVSAHEGLLTGEDGLVGFANEASGRIDELEGRADEGEDALKAVDAELHGDPDDEDDSGLVGDVRSQGSRIDDLSDELSSMIRADSEAGELSVGLVNSADEYVGFRTVLTADGMDVVDAGGSSAARYGETSRVGYEGQMHIEARPDRLSFMQGGTSLPSVADAPTMDPDEPADGEVAYLAADASGESTFYMTRTVVVRELAFGDWLWRARPNGHLSLTWNG